MATVDLTAWNDALYVNYDNDKKYQLCDLMNPTLSSIEKDTEFGGRNASQNLIYQIGGGGSASIATTIANSLASVPEEFLAITRQKMYEVALIDNETIEASTSDKTSFARVLDEVDRKMQAAANRVESRLHRGRGGWIGRIAVGTVVGANAVCTLDDKADAFNFYKGQKVCFASTDGTSGSLRDAGDTLIVASVQREAGTVTFTTNMSNIAAIADTDYLFTEGDFGACINSFYDWVPLDRTILGTSFYGVTRSDDPDRLAGLYYDGVGEPYLETLTRVVGMLGNHMGGGGQEFIARCHPDIVTEMTIAAQGKMTIEVSTLSSTRKVDMGVKTHTLTLGASRVQLAPTWASRTDRMIVGKADTFRLKSAGEFPKFLNRTGALHMMEGADTYQARIGGYGNLLCKAPGWNCAVKLAAVRTA